MRRAVAVLGIMIFAASAEAQIQTEAAASGLNAPVALRTAPDGRRFVVEQDGRIERLEASGQVAATPLLDLSDETGLALTEASGEQGLLGLAFHPQFASNGFFYINYTDNSGDTVIARYTISAMDPDVADNGSGQVLLNIVQDFGNHNGGDLHFGPDGYLYIGMGDGGSAGDPNDRAQQRDSLLGKMLRLDVDNPGQNTDGACGAAVNYGIPPDNPFEDVIGTCTEIAALGLRNPYRFSFDRQTGDLWIADVGQDSREEINLLPGMQVNAGVNFGWDCREGDIEFGSSSPLCADLTNFIEPVMTYNHLNIQGTCESVTGGFRYRGPSPALQGLYFFADICRGEMYVARQSQGQWTFESAGFPGGVSGFGEDADGRLYLTTYNPSGPTDVLRIVDNTLFASGFEIP